YSFHILPRIGQLVAQDAESYRYLAESIRMHPDQETLKAMIDEVVMDDQGTRMFVCSDTDFCHQQQEQQYAQ
ncbi:alpha-D-ribose 1-methylphosphonate 5-phosphate C-P-lyase PhnJ, partial [Pantoea agglomerans]|uniref:alpha-D-ribose 1-methylphosphonate 5-phosphate C-P-lyase PhnJ n=1 Tax=Enterobacter agglomerans TaxID=549 RepID=UPI001A8FFE43